MQELRSESMIEKIFSEINNQSMLFVYSPNILFESKIKLPQRRNKKTVDLYRDTKELQPNL